MFRKLETTRLQVTRTMEAVERTADLAAASVQGVQDNLFAVTNQGLGAAIGTASDLRELLAGPAADIASAARTVRFVTYAVGALVAALLILELLDG